MKSEEEIEKGLFAFDYWVERMRRRVAKGETFETGIKAGMIEDEPQDEFRGYRVTGLDIYTLTFISNYVWKAERAEREMG